jgi:hypothetical protein
MCKAFNKNPVWIFINQLYNIGLLTLPIKCQYEIRIALWIGYSAIFKTQPLREKMAFIRFGHSDWRIGLYEANGTHTKIDAILNRGKFRNSDIFPLQNFVQIVALYSVKKVKCYFVSVHMLIYIIVNYR